MKQIVLLAREEYLCTPFENMNPKYSHVAGQTLALRLEFVHLGKSFCAPFTLIAPVTQILNRLPTYILTHLPTYLHLTIYIPLRTPLGR